MRKKKREAEGDAAFGAPAGRPRMTPEDIQQKEFRLAFRGYNERDVDEFLDQATEDLAALTEENRRLREQGGITAPPAFVGDASSQAEEILANARTEAERIVREAEGRAVVVGDGSSADARGVIAPYLNREREFLQSLGQLVQGHAETIRGMVQSHRTASAGRVEPPPSPVEPRAEEPGTVAIPDEASEPEPVPAEQQRSLRELFWGED